jgi:hypothetical protein
MDERDNVDVDSTAVVEIVAEQQAPLSQQQIVEIVGAENCMATCSG